MRCEETNIWKHQILDKRSRNITAEVGMTRIKRNGTNKECIGLNIKRNGKGW
jgi:hypothetical protein